MPSTEIPRLLRSLSGVKDSTPVALHDDDRVRLIEPVSLLRKAGIDTEKAAVTLKSYLAGIVARESGPEAGGKAEALMKRTPPAKPLTAGQCREILALRGAPPVDAEAVKAFAAQVPPGVLQSLRFSAMSPSMQTAVMQGYDKGLDMMRALVDLYDATDGALLPDSPCLSLETIQAVQKALAKHSRGWTSAMTAPLSQGDADNGHPEALDAVHRLFQSVQPKLATRFLSIMTLGAVADIFTVQSFVIKNLEQFSENHPRLPGIDGKSPAARLSLLRALLFELACRHVRVRKGLTVDRLITAEVRMLLQSDIRFALGALLRLYMNHALSGMPGEDELRPRANIKGFDDEGFHADFVRDCIARRCSFFVEGSGKLPNAVDREQAVAAGKRDREFYEKLRDESRQRLAAWQDGQRDRGESAPEALLELADGDWELPDARGSASMTAEDLKRSRGMAMFAMKDIPFRMAVSALANVEHLRLFESFFCRDPASGIQLQGGFKHMDVLFSPDKELLKFRALLFHDLMRSLEGVDSGEVPLGHASLTQVEYSVFLKKKVSKEGRAPVWRVGKVIVENVVPHFVPRLSEESPPE